MAKAIAECTCRVCGANFTMTAVRCNRRDANAWEVWASDHYDLCSTCWGKEQRTIQAQTPLTLNIDCDPYNQLIILHFSGNTITVKDDIKRLGYFWGYLPSIGVFGAFDARSKMAWYKVIKAVDLEMALADEFKAAEHLKPKINNRISNADAAIFREIKAEKDARDAAIAKIPRPRVPAVLKGKKWNRKIYGKSGTYCIYIDNQKIQLTNDEAGEIRDYLAARESYEKEVAALGRTE
jgi:hypothetical protein